MRKTMLFLVEVDRVQTGQVPTPQSAGAFIEQIIFPTLAGAQKLVAEKKILSGGAVVGRIALRFIMEADSPEHVDRMITGLPIWPLAEVRVTPLITFDERREHVKTLLENIAVQV
jgi:muconolactone delta-isomerase